MGPQALQPAAATPGTLAVHPTLANVSSVPSPQPETQPFAVPHEPIQAINSPFSDADSAKPLSPEVAAQLQCTLPQSILCTRIAIYLFAGQHRKSSIGAMLTSEGWKVFELDILISKRHDLTNSSLRASLLARIDSGEFDLVIASPPCNTHTRVKFANSFGPPPTRTKDFPRGALGHPRPATD